jgi:hypothetical protein
MKRVKDVSGRAQHARATQRIDRAPEREQVPDATRLVGEGADQEMATAALELRRHLAEQYGDHNPLQRLLLDSAANGYYLQRLLGGWTATVTNVIEREFFRSEQGEPKLVIYDLYTGPLAFAMERVGQQLGLQRRAGKMLDGFLQELDARANEQLGGGGNGALPQSNGHRRPSNKPDRAASGRNAATRTPIDQCDE